MIKSLQNPGLSGFTHSQVNSVTWPSGTSLLPSTKWGTTSSWSDDSCSRNNMPQVHPGIKRYQDHQQKAVQFISWWHNSDKRDKWNPTSSSDITFGMSHLLSLLIQVKRNLCLQARIGRHTHTHQNYRRCLIYITWSKYILDTIQYTIQYMI